MWLLRLPKSEQQARDLNKETTMSWLKFNTQAQDLDCQLGDTSPGITAPLRLCPSVGRRLFLGWDCVMKSKAFELAWSHRLSRSAQAPESLVTLLVRHPCSTSRWREASLGHGLGLKRLVEANRMLELVLALVLLCPVRDLQSPGAGVSPRMPTHFRLARFWVLSSAKRRYDLVAS